MTGFPGRRRRRWEGTGASGARLDGGSWLDLSLGAQTLKVAAGGRRGPGVALSAGGGQGLVGDQFAHGIQIVVLSGAEARIVQGGQHAPLPVGLGPGPLAVGQEEAADFLLQGRIEIAANENAAFGNRRRPPDFLDLVGDGRVATGQFAGGHAV